MRENAAATNLSNPYSLIPNPSPRQIPIYLPAIIAVVTLAICLGGLCIGRRFGTRLAGKASILGGAILLVIGVEIFIKNM